MFDDKIYLSIPEAAKALKIDTNAVKERSGIVINPSQVTGCVIHETVLLQEEKLSGKM